MRYLYETEKWAEMLKGLERQLEAEGGSTGSNMTEPHCFPPGPSVMPENLSPEEVARIEKELKGQKKHSVAWGNKF